MAGAVVERHPAAAAALDRWAEDPDFWIRRAALLAEFIPLREGRGDFARFARHADGMLADPEFFIRKAIGWVLRDTAKHDPEPVVRWLLPALPAPRRSRSARAQVPAPQHFCSVPHRRATRCEKALDQKGRRA
ncbi:MAG: DNA alkylation repair protein [Anaeromyxobacteraceae bacterium]